MRFPQTSCLSRQCLALCPSSNLQTGASDGRGSISIHQIPPISQNPDARSFNFTDFFLFFFTLHALIQVCDVVLHAIVPNWRKHRDKNQSNHCYRGKIRGFASHHYPFLFVCHVNLPEDNAIHAQLPLRLSGSESEKSHLWPSGSFQSLRHIETSAVGSRRESSARLYEETREARVDHNPRIAVLRKLPALVRKWHWNQHLASQDLQPPLTALLANVSRGGNNTKAALASTTGLSAQPGNQIK